MRADIENEIAILDELAVEAIHRGGVRAIAVVDAQRPKNAARGLQQSEHVSDRTEGRHRRRGLDRGQRERAQRGGRRGFLRQTANTGADTKSANTRPGSHHREGNGQCQAGREKGLVGNRSRPGRGQGSQCCDPEQRVRPQRTEGQRQWHRVVVARLPDPPDFMWS